MPERLDGKGKALGGGAFTRGHLYKILGNPLYVGRLVHRGQVHAGLVDPAVFDAVQARLAANHHAHTAPPRAASVHLLIGRIQDGRGRTMTPTQAQKGRLRYRYYVGTAAAAATGDAGPSDGIVKDAATTAATPVAVLPALRIPAARMEAVVVGTLRGRVPPGDQPSSDAALVAEHLTDVAVHPDRLVLALMDRRQPHTVA